MTELLHFALLGLGVGALYAFAAQGLVLIFRGSGVLNFAYGAIGIAAAYVQWELNANHGVPWGVAALAGVAFAALVGATIHLVIMRRLNHSAPLIRVVATLGVLVLIEGIATIKYGATSQAVSSVLPQHVLRIAGDITTTTDRVYLLAISAALTVALWAAYRFTRFGLATTAVAENERAAATLGWSSDLVATANWALGCALAGAAAILLAPITALSVQGIPNLLLVTLAAALIGNFRSFPLTFVGGLAIGVMETVLSYYSNAKWGTWSVGISSAVPFVVIVAILVLRGRALPLRDHFLQRTPSVGSGRVRPVVVAGLTLLTALLISRVSPNWADSFTTTFTVAIILLSIVVVTGYGGQISLATFAIAGFAAWVEGRLIEHAALPFTLAFLGGVAGAVLLGLAFALPAVRTRGINLAIVTLGLGSALEAMLFLNDSYTGGTNGTVIGSPSLFGWDFDAVLHPNRYATVCLIAFVVCSLMVANVRRGRSGRRLLAVRTNERAAAALGISVVSAKLYAFGLSAAIAAVGGMLMFSRTTSIVFGTISNSTSIMLVALAVIGGIGYLTGPLIGATLFAGAIGTQIGDSIFSAGVTRWLQALSGAILILLILQEPDGVAKSQLQQARWVAQRLGRRLRRPRRQAALEPAGRIEPVRPRTLEVRDVTVRYGGAVANAGVSLALEPGQIVGLIGPNGAGKTTLVDAITGFTRPNAGTLMLDGRDITRWSAARRARAGISRSFQSLELFEDMTVLDNLRTASEPRDLRSYLLDLAYPVTPPLPAQVRAAIAEFALEGQLDRSVEALSYGERRLLAMARAVATAPSVLLLDECAAGLDETETRELGRLVRRLATEWGMAILVIEHDVEFVMSVCDRIVVLDFGHKIADGTPDEVRVNERVIEAYLGEPDGEADEGAAEVEVERVEHSAAS
jgi:sulfate-transporting ATPase